MTGEVTHLHASTVIAEVEGYPPVSPDVLLGDCTWLCFDLDRVGMVVGPCGAVASAYCALAGIDVFGQSLNGHGDGAAVAGRADWSSGGGGVLGFHLSISFFKSVLFVRRDETRFGGFVR